MTDNTPATTLVVVTMPVEGYLDYENPTSPRSVVVRLSDQFGGKRTGGGTDLTTQPPWMSDLDIEVPVANVAAFCEALTGVGLSYRTVAPPEGV